jgi:F0F1-type ATP synthase gamma subunit
MLDAYRQRRDRSSCLLVYNRFINTMTQEPQVDAAAAAGRRSCGSSD